jgi:hypothetical protein
MRSTLAELDQPFIGRERVARCRYQICSGHPVPTDGVRVIFRLPPLEIPDQVRLQK